MKAALDERDEVLGGCSTAGKDPWLDAGAGS